MYSLQWDKSNALNINCVFMYFCMGMSQNWFLFDSCKSGLFLESLSFLGIIVLLILILLLLLGLSFIIIIGPINSRLLLLLGLLLQLNDYAYVICINIMTINNHISFIGFYVPIITFVFAVDVSHPFLVTTAVPLLRCYLTLFNFNPNHFFLRIAKQAAKGSIQT